MGEPERNGVPRWVITTTAVCGLIAAVLTVGIKFYEFRRVRAEPEAAAASTPAAEPKPTPDPKAVAADPKAVAPRSPAPPAAGKAVPPPPQTNPPAPIPAGAIDLLARIDPDRDTDGPGWTKSTSPPVLRPPEQPRTDFKSRLLIPYAPVPPAYALELEVARRSQGMGLNVGFVAGGHQTMLVVDGFALDGGRSALELVDGKPGRDNETTHRGRLLTVDQPRRLRLRVRPGGVDFDCDDRPIIRWQGDARRLSLFDGWRVRDPNVLFLGAQARFDITRLVLIPE